MRVFVSENAWDREAVGGVPYDIALDGDLPFFDTCDRINTSETKR